jgi:putative ABC transport system substrate-binding protein
VPTGRRAGIRVFHPALGLHVIARFAERQIDRIPALVDELVAQRVKVIVVFSDQAIQAAQRATTTIPIVVTASDVIKIGFAACMAHRVV